MLALSWGGHTYPWTSPQVLGLLAVTAVSLGLFVAVELRFPEPLLPLDLFRNKVFTFSNAAAFVISMAFFGAITFLPLYLQLGLGVPATKSGVAILPMMFGLVLSSGLAGRLVSKHGHYKRYMIGGAGLNLNQLQALALAQTEHRHIVVDPTLRTVFSRAIVDLFWVGGGVAILGLIFILLIPELPLHGRGHSEPVAEPGEEFLKEEEAETAKA